MKRKIPGMIAGMFFLLCTLEAFSIKNKQITVLPGRQSEYQITEGNCKEEPVETIDNSYEHSKPEKEEEAQAVTAEAARCVRTEYNIKIISLLLVLTLLMLLLLIKKPAEKRKRKRRK